MIKFLHVGDIHLGYRQYKLLEREQDFFKAFLDVCQKGAIEGKADFVLVTGDLFNYRNISPQTFNEATYVFNRLKQAGIPVIAIEGNHDFKETGTFNNVRGSWYEALAQNQLIYFLNPLNHEESNLEPLIPEQKFLGGGYIDLKCKEQIVRIVGSRWQGFNAGAALPLYANRIQKIPENVDFTIFMFHAGQENYLPVNRGGVSSTDFKVLENCVDYVALGHIHEHYILKNSSGKDFIFNPGSTEANASSEIDIQRGGLVVEVDEKGNIEHSLLKTYSQRKFIKLPVFLANKFSNFEELVEEILSASKESLENLKATLLPPPVLVITIEGYCNYEKNNASILDLKKKIEELGVLLCLINWNVQANEAVMQDLNLPSVSKKEREKSLLEQLLLADESIAEHQEFANTMLAVKESILERSVEPAEILSLLLERSKDSPAQAFEEIYRS